MKKADIKVGEDYAYSTDQDHYRWPGHTGRVKVLEHIELGGHRSWDKKIPGVLIQHLDERGNPRTRPILNDQMEATGEVVELEAQRVPNRTIKEPWADFEANIKSMRERAEAEKIRKAEVEAKRAVLNNAVMDEIQRRVPEFGKGYGRYFFMGEERFRQGQTTKIEMTVEAMAELLGIPVEADS